MKNLTSQATIKRIRLATVLSIMASVLGACSSVPQAPQQVLVPIEVSDRATLPSIRLSWYPGAPETPGPGSLTFGAQMAYARSSGQSDQSIGTNEYISLDGNRLTGPQSVRHTADLDYGHLAFIGIKRFSGRASWLELEWIVGIGAMQLDLHSKGSASGAEIAKGYEHQGVVAGIGPRWNITSKLAIEGRLNFLLLFFNNEDEFFYPEIAVRYRPTNNIAIRVGYSEMSYNPFRKDKAESRVKVHLYGPSLGLDVSF